MFPARYCISHVITVSRAGIVFRAILIIPHLPVILLRVAGLALGSIAGWPTCVVMGSMPVSIWHMQDRAIRYLVRVTAWLFFLTDVRPPFSGRAVRLHAVKVHHDKPDAWGRPAALFRPFLLLPYLIWALPYTLGVACVTAVSLPVMLVTGRRPMWLIAAGEEWLVYMARVLAWACLVVDEYPPYNGVQPASIHAWFHDAQQATVQR